MDYKKAYTLFLEKYINLERPLTVVFDASNGPAGMVVKDLFNTQNGTFITIHDDIDPDFKAHGPNPLIPGASDSCKNALLKHAADIGVMFDADGDRSIFLDDEGCIIPACFIAALLFKYSKSPYVADELVFQSLRMLNVVPLKDIVPSRIGSYFIKEEMRNHNATCGAEYSGHYYFKDFFNADSGIYASIMVLNILSRMDQKLSVWRKQYGNLKTITKEINIVGKDMQVLYENLEKKYAGVFKERRDGVTLCFDTYWINVRPSNTEPIMRIIAEGSGDIDETVREIEEII